MKLSKKTINDLKEIIKEEFKFNLSDNDTEKLAYSLVGYFDSLIKINSRLEVRNYPDRVIDNKIEKAEDRPN